MIENSVGQSLLQKALQDAAAQPQTSTPTAEAGSDDVSRLEQAMEAPSPAEAAEEATTRVDPNQASLHLEAIDANNAAPSPGDRLLQGLEKLRSDHQTQVANVDKALNADPSTITQQDLLRTQMEISKMALQEQVTSKVAGRVTTGIETLFKNQ